MTTRTSKLIVIQQNATTTSTAAGGGDGHAHLEICPTCGQQLLPSIEQTPLLPPAATAAAAICPNEHETEET